MKPGDLDQMRGIDRALFQLFDHKFPGVLTGVVDAALQSRAKEWLNSTFATTAVEESSVRRAAMQFLAATLDGNQEVSELAATYLRGEKTTAEQRHRIGIAEPVNAANGFRMLRSLCQLFQRSGLATGTVLLFDEARRSLSLMSVRQQLVACENLLSVINHCNNGHFPGTVFLYAVMPEFFTDFATQYPALQQRCGPSTRIRLNSLHRTVEELSSDFRRLPFEPYAPVRVQLSALLRQINRRRKVAGLEEVPSSSLRWKRSPVLPFDTGETSDNLNAVPQQEECTSELEDLK